VLATWKFRAARTGSAATWIRRRCGQNTLTGSERDALDFAARITEHFRATDIHSVEAWSVGPVEGTPDLPDAITFRIVPHANGKDWAAEENQLMHPLWITELDFGVDYIFRRGSGRLCAIEVLGRSGEIEHLIVADKRQVDSCPFIAPSALRSEC
jgi:hypothetical protein